MAEPKLRAAWWKRSLPLVIASLALAISVAALGLSIINYTHPQQVAAYRNVTANSTRPLPHYNITSALLSPNVSLPGYPAIAANQPFGRRLTNINAPLNSSELSVINSAPDSYFETAGLMYLNHSINNTVLAQASKVPAFVVNGKPSVIYLGSLTCIFCGENRWAMALALSRFGNFTYLFKGYSSLNDADVPTLYWAPATYSTSSTDTGSFYTSRYINFIVIEDTNPITGGFVLNPLSTIQRNVNATGNLAYKDAMQYIIDANNFQGTPYTIWGYYQNSGADAVDFGNAPPTGTSIPLTNMTHGQVLQQLANLSDQFAYTEYAAADVYVAQLCGTIENSAPVCSLSAIQGIERAYGY